MSIGTCFDIMCQWLHRQYQQEKMMLFVIMHPHFSVLEIFHSLQLCIGNDWEHTTHVHFSYANRAVDDTYSRLCLWMRNFVAQPSESPCRLGKLAPETLNLS